MVAGTMHMSIEVLGDKIIERNFVRHAARAMNAMPVFEVLAERFLEIEKLQFESQGVSGSGGWTPLSATYLAEKVSQGYDPRILFRTHALFESLTHHDAEGSIRRITPEFMEVGTDLESEGGYVYALAHQQGHGVPVRKPVDLTEMERRRWMKTVQRYIVLGEVVFGGGSGR